MNTDISAALTARRQIAGYSQEQLAAALHVSRQAISKWERGEAMPDTANLVAMADLYHISLDELLDRNDGSKPVETPAEAQVTSPAEEAPATAAGTAAWPTYDPSASTSDTLTAEPPTAETAGPNLPPLASPQQTRARVKLSHPALKIIPLMATALYVILGFTLNAWAWAWVVFLAYPIAIAIIGALHPKPHQDAV